MAMGARGWLPSRSDHLDSASGTSPCLEWEKGAGLQALENLLHHATGLAKCRVHCYAASALRPPAFRLLSAHPPFTALTCTCRGT